MRRNAQRDSIMIGMFTRGMTYQEIGEAYGVSRQRIEQIMRRNGITKEQGGFGLQSLIRVAVKKEAREIALRNKEEKVFKVYGCSAEKILELTGSLPHGYWSVSSKDYPWAAYRMQRHNALGTGKGWDISFPEWWQVWQESGKWELPGRGKATSMPRYGDSGPYKMGNVYICTVGQNFADSYLVKSAHSRMLKNPNFINAKGYHEQRGKFYIHVDGRTGPYKSALAARRAFLKKRRERYG